MTHAGHLARAESGGPAIAASAATAPSVSPARHAVRRFLPALVGFALFALALEVLRRELRAVTWPQLRDTVLTTPAWRLWLTLALTMANYLALTVYDFLAVAYIRKRLPPLRVAAVSFLAYAIANNVGFAAVSGATVRYRFYTRWGVTGEELSRLVVAYSTTFWLGLLLLGGASLAAGPAAVADVPGHWLAQPVGWLLLLVVAAFLTLAALRRAPIAIRGYVLPVPSFAMALAQVSVSAVEWTLAGSVLYVLLPPSELTYLSYIGAFLAAQLLGLSSHVPGGVGVFETLMVLLLKPYLDSPALLPALVVYRAVYYILPLTLALVGLVLDEVYQRRAHTARASAFLGQLTEQFTPQLLSSFTFLAGLVLLFSGATPAAAGRLARLDHIVPLGVIETSHFLGSLVGVALIILAHGLWRRLDAAYYLTIGAIGLGFVASLLKGGGLEEAALLGALLLVLRRAKPAFARKAALFEARFSPEWTMALFAAVGASVWLGLFAFKHVDYSAELWWQFELSNEASRFLRASVGAGVMVLLFGLARLVRQAPYDAPRPSPNDLARVDAIMATQPSAAAHLVYLGDKSVLFDDERAAFVMYGVQGRTWVALGDPVGSSTRRAAAARAFLERCDDFGGVPTFYQLSKDHLHLYADFGLTFVKIGEEASVDLRALSFAGGKAARWRQALRRLEKEGLTFRVALPAETAALMPRLRAVSDDWLSVKAGGEKGFSLGFFDPAYLCRFPIALVERGERVLAFANIWTGAAGEEVSIDLMRYHHDAPTGVMESLVVHLLRWAQAEGYGRFLLGMAPLSGVETSPVGPLWNRLGAFVYEHGERFYNFQGLRAFKDKFDPAWEPRYLAYPGGFRLPVILADVAALIAGGYRRIFAR